MIALEDVSAGECLFEIPRRLLLSADNCGIADILSKGNMTLGVHNSFMIFCNLHAPLLYLLFIGSK